MAALRPLHDDYMGAAFHLRFDRVQTAWKLRADCKQAAMYIQGSCNTITNTGVILAPARIPRVAEVASVRSDHVPDA